jgi:hypothetical protein
MGTISLLMVFFGRAFGEFISWFRELQFEEQRLKKSNLRLQCITSGN